jgi:multiple sugar transport system substrate-binding protein
MQRIIFALLAALLVTPVFAAGQQDAVTDDEVIEIELTYWANTVQNDDYAELARSFEEKYPQYRVKLNQYASTEEFWNALPIAISAQAAPDIIAYTDEGASEYIANGVVAPLEELMESVDFDREVIIDSLWSGWTYQNQTYGVPRDAATSMFFVNEDLFDAAGLDSYPQTMEELAEAAVALTSEDVYGICVNLHEFHLTQYVHAFGGGWDFGSAIDSPENERGLEFIVELYDSGAAVTPGVLGASWDGEVFAQGKAAMSTGGAWYLGYLRDAAPDLNYRIMPIPEGTERTQSAFSGGYSILSQSEHKEAAMLFIQHALDKQSQRNSMNRLGNAPARKDLLPEFLEANPELQPFFETLADRGRPFSYPAQTRNFNTQLIDGLETMVFASTSMTVEDLLSDLQAEFGM